MIKYHPIRIKDAENVPNVGKEHNATVQRALTPVTDKVLCTLSSIIQEKSIKKIIHTYACTYIFTYMQFQYQLHLHKQFQEVYY